MPLAGICAGGAEQSVSLPRPVILKAPFATASAVSAKTAFGMNWLSPVHSI